MAAPISLSTASYAIPEFLRIVVADEAPASRAPSPNRLSSH